LGGPWLAADSMVLLVEGPDTHPHWARCIIPRGIALVCVAMGAAFSSLRPGPVLRAMFFVDFVTMLGSESAVHVYLSALSPRAKRVLLLLILLVDTSTLVAMLSELPEGWAAAIGRVLLFCLAFGCSAGCWASLIPGAAGAIGAHEPPSARCIPSERVCLRLAPHVLEAAAQPYLPRLRPPAEVGAALCVPALAGLPEEEEEWSDEWDDEGYDPPVSSGAGRSELGGRGI